MGFWLPSFPCLKWLWSTKLWVSNLLHPIYTVMVTTNAEAEILVTIVLPSLVDKGEAEHLKWLIRHSHLWPEIRNWWHTGAGQARICSHDEAAMQAMSCSECDWHWHGEQGPRHLVLVIQTVVSKLVKTINWSSGIIWAALLASQAMCLIPKPSQ